ncbi:ATP-grasp domain-containing protein [Streptomyces sp. SL13]|uniref:ATP-grasp domain-containing protein n=1 Tax=Streptantibioticus silvisoli TaxID=2705255 RepID=A0AA90K0Y3_9ACTN|nr:ATP-grasp domain-containing protein [Streptantibioticus silvisoli]MDI5973421.1 ATP-grasp domain-containing protein [Streptantibioticus silvisoli]
MFVHCADPLAPRRADPHYAGEVAAGGVLIDHDALLAGDTAGAVARVRRGAGPAWYRGWMMPSDRYAALWEALAERGVTLLTSPEHYRRAHELPGWYGVFEGATPVSAWLPLSSGRAPDAGSLAAVARRLGGGPGIVKDYVKSRKHEWHEACYVPDLADTDQLTRVATRFVELQEEYLTGGLVLRRFEEFDGTGEARVWWVDGEPVLTTPHPDAPEQRPVPELGFVAPLVAALGCRFLTTDLARRTDGVWRVVEAGDGGVSDLPRGAAPDPLMRALAAAATT